MSRRTPRLLILIPLALPALAAGPNPADEILAYLDHTIDWERQIVSLDPTPISTQDVVFRETARQSVRQALQLGFQIARAQAALLAPPPQPRPQTLPASTAPSSRAAPPRNRAERSRTIGSAAAAANQAVAQIQDQLNQLDADLPSAAPDQLPILQARRDKLLAQLNFAKTRQDALQNLIGFMSAQDTTGSAGTLQRIDELEKTTPDVHPSAETTSTEKSAAAADAASTQKQFREESVGILGLVEELFTLTNRSSDLADLADRTRRLIEHNEKLRDPLRAELQDITRRGEALAQSTDTDDAGKLDAQRQQLDALAARFKLLTSAAVPLSNQSVLLESTHNTLEEWRANLTHAYHRLIRSLLIRVAVVAALILLLLGFSKLWGRLALRYVTDVRRRRQFLFLRRIVVGSVIVLIVIGSIVAEFGSLATFAGLITAGIAVSLQTVILSGIAHFFFMGRYGVRVGDRVTLNNVTGDVLDVGLFRIYLMELKGNPRDLRPTGRIVVFANSVFFQPTAFYKQFPGVNYTWHEVALTLAPDTDNRVAEQRLLGAVQSVYNTYKSDIDSQYDSLSQSMHVAVAPPKIEGRLRLVDAGLEYVIRYPVDNQKAADIDDQITRKLLQAIEQEPRLKLVPTGTPEIQSADAGASPPNAAPTTQQPATS